GSYVGGMQKTPPNVAGCSFLSVTSPAAVPKMRMVCAVPPPGANAPGWFCSHFSYGSTQSSFESQGCVTPTGWGHWLDRVLPSKQSVPGSSSLPTSRQKPQNTRGVPSVLAVLSVVPVERVNEIGMEPIVFAGFGGQSWL